jgi:hypothetical protein
LGDPDIAVWGFNFVRRLHEFRDCHLCKLPNSCCCLRSNRLADQRRVALQRFNRHIAFRFQDTINLCAAGVHQLRQPRFAHALPFHFLAELSGNDTRHGFGFRGFANAVLVEEIVKRRSPMRVLFGLAHRSFMRFSAKSRSVGGVFCVFLTKPCTTPIRLSAIKKQQP